MQNFACAQNTGGTELNAKHLTELKIRNFRGFEALELSGLQAVNLIVGENNSGKTSLLEAIGAVLQPQQFAQIPKMFRAQESHATESFYRWTIRDAVGSDAGSIQASGPELNNQICFFRKPSPDRRELQHIHNSDSLQGYAANSSKSIPFCSIPVHQIGPDSLVKSFGDAVRPSSGEEIMHDVLRSMDSRLRRIRVDPTPRGNIIAVDLGLSESIPLSQAGQGMLRLVTILSNLLGAKPKVCIIDEIENGIHYSALPRVWRGLARICELLGVQIFATTHSKECLESAHRVFFDEDKEGTRDLAVIQLMRVDGWSEAQVLDEDRVEDALEINLELR
jgi:predicted ATPase